MSMDPLDAQIAALRAQSDQTVAFYRSHLRKLVAAYRKHASTQDPDVLLNAMVKSLMESDNDREALAYQVVVAVDLLARGNS